MKTIPTIRSHFSFQQFEEALQKLAHGMAIEAVMNLDQGRIKITTNSNNKFNTVHVGNVEFRFYAKHASYTEEPKREGTKWFSFDVEEKFYLTSNHSTKISFYAPEGKEKEVTEKITKFIDKLMAEASIKPVPRFSLSKLHKG